MAKKVRKTKDRIVVLFFKVEKEENLVVSRPTRLGDCGYLHGGILRGCWYRRLTAKENNHIGEGGNDEREKDQVDHKILEKGVLHQGSICQGENIAGKLGESEGDLRLAG